MERLLVEARGNGPIRLDGAHGESVWGVNLRSVPYKGKTLVNLLNFSRESRSIRIVTRPAVKTAVNLLDGKQVEFPMTLAPLEPVLLEVTMAAEQ